jgi:hypothetical protein
MSQRGSGYERKERDLYETPWWCTEALIPHLPWKPKVVWEPACGGGKMVAVLNRHAHVWAADIEPKCEGAETLDFFDLDPAESHLGDHPIGIITNPPYELATEFCEHALRLMEPVSGLVAMLLRTDFDHAKSRSHLFRDCPAFAKKVVLTKRIKWFEESKGQPSFNHSWWIWDWKHDGPPTIGYAP